MVFRCWCSYKTYKERREGSAGQCWAAGWKSTESGESREWMEIETPDGGRGWEGGAKDGERVPAHTVKGVNIRCGDKAPQTNIDQIRHFSRAASTVSQPERQSNNQHFTADKGSTGRMQETANLQQPWRRGWQWGEKGGMVWWRVKGVRERGGNTERQQERGKWNLKRNMDQKLTGW